MINASRLYLVTNAQMVPVEQRHTLSAQLKATTFCFGIFRTPEAIVIALLATKQTMTHLQEQFRVLEFEQGMTEQDYLGELYQPDEIIPLKKEREHRPRMNETWTTAAGQRGASTNGKEA